jgi:hypothetical protein
MPDMRRGQHTTTDKSESSQFSKPNGTNAGRNVFEQWAKERKGSNTFSQLHLNKQTLLQLLAQGDPDTKLCWERVKWVSRDPTPVQTLVMITSGRFVMRGGAMAGIRALAAARKPLSAQAACRAFHVSRPVFAKEFVGEGLESDPTRGVRIKLDAFKGVQGVPRSSEYDSVLEQDPLGDKHETGGNDDIWGEWGLDKDMPSLSTLQALGMWTVGMTSLYLFYKTALANSPKQVAAPREGVWSQ